MYPREQGGSGSINSWSTEAIGSKEGAFYKFMEHRSHREQGGSGSTILQSMGADGTAGESPGSCSLWSPSARRCQLPCGTGTV